MEVMIVEDDEPIRELIGSALQSAGYAYSTASNGVEALDLLKTHSPLAILLDVNMPQMDGFTLLARLKADPGTRDIPVLMLTAQSAPADIQRAIQLGARDYIGKPFETRQLLRRVDRMLHA